ncbi:hypothetical protein RR48_13080 [Papilio machaon]|uniref:Uncharacterized protein n=1 Tax=Papilio machaon TaxID=76193 RepID=A0A194QXN7_PAPMA|nr:hypothetical protein RR48_13080 [Papilio machaon]
MSRYEAKDRYARRSKRCREGDRRESNGRVSAVRPVINVEMCVTGRGRIPTTAAAARRGVPSDATATAFTGHTRTGSLSRPRRRRRHG